MPASEQKTAKAKIAKADKKGKAVADTDFEVQFNPSTLRVQTRTNVEGGRSSGRPARSQNGINTVTLSVELIFDTSDDGSTEEPVDVQTLTAQFRRFVEPQASNAKKPPDPIWFHWGKFTFTGIVESLDEELEYFSFYGVALRAKVTLSIKRQDFKHEANESGQGARDQAAAQGRDSSGAAAQSGAPGTAGDGGGDGADEALGGESAADFAQRHGLPAAAWRAIANAAIDNPLSLPAGLEVPFPRSVNLGGGVTAQVGATAGTDLTVGAAVRASVGVGETTGGATSRPDPAKIGSAGGLEAAVEAIASIEATEAAQTERSARSSPATSPTAGGAAPGGAAATSAAPIARPPAPRAAAELPYADRRATSYGRGVPLREVARTARAARPTISAIPAGPERRRPSDPPWITLPTAATTTTALTPADIEQQARRSTVACGCCTPPGPRRCRCGCHGGGGH